MLEKLFHCLDGMTNRAVDLHRGLTAIPALGPDNGGHGEWAKARMVMDLCRDMGLADIREANCPDARVPEKTRPNFAAVLPGQDTSRTLWIIAHLDIVPPGDLSLWTGDPYTLRVEGDRVMGRGTEDNHQALVSGLLLAEALLEHKVTPPMNLGLLCVADEETGSDYGLKYVVEHHKDMFGANDLFLVPDFGQPDSAGMEVAEKSMMWLKFTVLGKQCHASTPGEGINTLPAAAELILAFEALADEYPAQDPLFDPPVSTFQPTKKEANVENVNTVPGKDVLYLDARVLPDIPVDGVLERIRELMAQVEAKRGVKVTMEPIQREQAAPSTSVDAEVVTRLAAGIRAVYGVEPKPVGIGGGTVAAVLRRAGYPAVVWATLEHKAHQPDESASIAHTVGDAKVMAAMLLGE